MDSNTTPTPVADADVGAVASGEFDATRVDRERVTRYEWLDAIAESSDIDAHGKAVALALFKHMKDRRGRCDCWPSIATIYREASMTKGTASARLTALDDLGYLERETGGGRKTTRYVATVPLLRSAPPTTRRPVAVAVAVGPTTRSGRPHRPEPTTNAESVGGGTSDAPADAGSSSSLTIDDADRWVSDLGRALGETLPPMDPRLLPEAERLAALGYDVDSAAAVVKAQGTLGTARDVAAVLATRLRRIKVPASEAKATAKAKAPTTADLIKIADDAEAALAAVDAAAMEAATKAGRWSGLSDFAWRVDCFNHALAVGGWFDVADPVPSSLAEVEHIASEAKAWADGGPTPEWAAEAEAVAKDKAERPARDLERQLRRDRQNREQAAERDARSRVENWHAVPDVWEGAVAARFRSELEAEGVIDAEGTPLPDRVGALDVKAHWRIVELADRAWKDVHDEVRRTA